jgi:hypothetical protein
MSARGKPELVVARDLTQFFHDRVRAVMNRQRVEARDEAVLYVVNLLTEHMRCESLASTAEAGAAIHPPLAELLAQARLASPEERVRQLRRLGDLALYVAGFFSEHLRRRLVDIDYYIGMGGGAYQGVAASLRARSARDLGALFDELAGKFARFVDVFAELSEDARPGTNADVVRLYERWQLTGSRWAAAKLCEAGLVPAQGARTALPEGNGGGGGGDGGDDPRTLN